MRMPPSLTRSSRSSSSKNNNKSSKQSDHHRRSWHLGTGHHHHHHSNSGKKSSSSKREGGKQRHRATWHFPRISRHSLHHHSYHRHDDDEENIPPPNDDYQYDVEMAQERKTFSYAPNYTPQEETATRAPSPPPESNTDTAPTDTNINNINNQDQHHQQQQREHHHQSSSSNSSKRKDGGTWLRKIKRKTFRVFRAIEDFLFPGCHPLQHGSTLHQQDQRVRGGVLLNSCLTAEEHRAKVRQTVELAQTMYGQEGLRAVGFEYRFMPCPDHHHDHCLTKVDDPKKSLFNDHNNNNSNNNSSNNNNNKDELLESFRATAEDHEEGEEVEQAAALLVGQEQQTSAPTTTTTTLEDPGDPVQAQDDADDYQQDKGATTTTATTCDAADYDADVAAATATAAAAPQQHHICHSCAHRLFHIESNTQINSNNRKQFIADGDMYDAVAGLAQENAHEVMQRQLGMVWVTLSPPPFEGDDDDNNQYCHPLMQNKHEPIRALVNREHFAAAAATATVAFQQHTGNVNGVVVGVDDDVPKEEQLEEYRHRPTLLIITGKGKVRAGIFSRQHSLVSGMEPSTAMPLIHEARLRKLNLVILDPNCHGDALGMDTFEKSMAKIFHQWENATTSTTITTTAAFDQQQRKQCCRDLYILSHSASGAQLARYLLEESEHYLPHIRAIAFTDSTHNVQWARQRGNKELVDFLESDACIMFRCATGEREAQQQAGEVAPTDNFWKHRFGSVRTCWAGTKEHSLTNWFAHKFIWEHFDKFLLPPQMDEDDHPGTRQSE